MNEATLKTNTHCITDFSNLDKMELEPFYSREIDGCVNKMVEILVQGFTLHTKDIIDFMEGIRFSNEFIKAVHAATGRKLAQKGLLLVAYPYIVPPYDTIEVHINGYMYQATPIHNIK